MIPSSGSDESSAGHDQTAALSSPISPPASGPLTTKPDSSANDRPSGSAANKSARPQRIIVAGSPVERPWWYPWAIVGVTLATVGGWLGLVIFDTWRMFNAVAQENRAYDQAWQTSAPPRLTDLGWLDSRYTAPLTRWQGQLWLARAGSMARPTQLYSHRWEPPRKPWTNGTAVPQMPQLWRGMKDPLPLPEPPFSMLVGPRAAANTPQPEPGEGTETRLWLVGETRLMWLDKPGGPVHEAAFSQRWSHPSNLFLWEGQPAIAQRMPTGWSLHVWDGAEWQAKGWLDIPRRIPQQPDRSARMVFADQMGARSNPEAAGQSFSVFGRTVFVGPQPAINPIPQRATTAEPEPEAATSGDTPSSSPPEQTENVEGDSGPSTETGRVVAKSSPGSDDSGLSSVKIVIAGDAARGPAPTDQVWVFQDHRGLHVCWWDGRRLLYRHGLSVQDSPPDVLRPGSPGTTNSQESAGSPGAPSSSIEPAGLPENEPGESPPATTHDVISDTARGVSPDRGTPASSQDTAAVPTDNGAEEADDIADVADGSSSPVLPDASRWVRIADPQSRHPPLYITSPIVLPAAILSQGNETWLLSICIDPVDRLSLMGILSQVSGGQDVEPTHQGVRPCIAESVFHGLHHGQRAAVIEDRQDHTLTAYLSGFEPTANPEDPAGPIQVQRVTATTNEQTSVNLRPEGGGTSHLHPFSAPISPWILSPRGLVFSILGCLILHVVALCWLCERFNPTHYVVEEQTARLAPLGRRIAASVIDIILVSVALVVAWPDFYLQPWQALLSSDALRSNEWIFETQLFNAEALRSALANDAGQNQTAELVVPYIVSFAQLLLLALCEFVFGGTPGKLCLGLTVRDRRLRPLGFAGAAVRNLLRIIDELFPPLTLAWVSWTSLRQRPGDMAIGSIVIVRRTLTSVDQQGPLS